MTRRKRARRRVARNLWKRGTGRRWVALRKMYCAAHVEPAEPSPLLNMSTWPVSKESKR